MVVQTQIENGVGVVVIDNPPVNALSKDVAAGILGAFQELLASDEVRAIVISAAGRTFVAGADVKQFQGMIEASGGEYVDHVSLQKGNDVAYKTMALLSSGNLYGPKVQPHDLQLMNAFDMSQGRFEEKLGTEMSRSVAGDIVGMSWMYNTRKWVELQAILQLGNGILYKKKVKMTSPDGTVKEISYRDAFETIDGQIKLKAGIDARYNVEVTKHTLKSTDTLESMAAQYHMSVEDFQKNLHNKNLDDMRGDVEDLESYRDDELKTAAEELEGDENFGALQDKTNAINEKYTRLIEEKGTIRIDNTEFKFMKNRMHQVANNMGGAYSKFDQPEAQRYIAFRMVSYMRRYFTTMAVSRWGFRGSILNPQPRLNPGMGDIQMGFYVEFAKSMISQYARLKSGGMYLTKSEQVAALKFLSELTMLWLVQFLGRALFGFDPDDEDRHKKLRAMSGVLEGPGINGDPDREFNAIGWTQLHMLHLFMQVRAENEQFNLYTGGVTQYNDLLGVRSVALGPTTDKAVSIWYDIKNILSGSPKANYSRKVGPYEWQEKEGSKLMTHVAKMHGLTGTSWDPALAIQNLESFSNQSKVRR